MAIDHDTVSKFRNLNLAQFELDDTHVLFSPETLRLFRLNAATARLIRGLREGKNPEELCRECRVSEAAAQSMLSALLSSLPWSTRCRRDADVATEPRALPKLVLMVNNYCNLNCAYCYEIKTVFSRKPARMPEKIVDAALQKILARFAGIGQLMFIGGEPNLSRNVIDFSCRRALEACAEQGVPAPSFCMMTNGTKMDEQMFALIEKYRVQVTFSLDGPKQVHDAVRVRKNGRGSYDEAAANLTRYAAKFEGRAGIECTVNRRHEDCGIGILDLLHFFHANFGVTRPHITAAGLEESTPLSLQSSENLEAAWREAARESARNVMDNLVHPGTPPKPALHTVCSIIDRLITHRGTDVMCPAGIDQLVVDALGDVYPCWMFAALPPFRLGNVADDNLFNSAGERALGEFRRNTKSNQPACSTCFARSMCSPCVGNNYNCAGSIALVDERHCRQVRTVVQTVIVEVVKAQQDAERWNSIRAGVKRSVRQRRNTDVC